MLKLILQNWSSAHLYNLLSYILCSSPWNYLSIYIYRERDIFFHILLSTAWRPLDPRNPAMSTKPSAPPPCPSPRFQKGSAQALTLQEVYICAAWCPWRRTSCEYSDLTLKDSIWEITTYHAVYIVDDSTEPMPSKWSETSTRLLHSYTSFRNRHPYCGFLSNRTVFV